MTTNAAAHVSSLLQQNKTISHTLTSLLSELKSLFFYEESSTLRDQLRQIVHKYEVLAKDDISRVRSVTSDAVERSRSTSLDTKERLKAFMQR